MLFATGYFILICVVSCMAGDAVVSYSGAQVWRTALQGAEDILLIKKLIDNTGNIPVTALKLGFKMEKIIKCLEISIWNLSPKQADYLVKVEDKMKVHRHLRMRNLDHTVLIMDVQRRIDALRPRPALWNENSLRMGHRLDFKSYPKIKIIDEYLRYLAENYPSLCRLQAIGRTWENRTLQMLNVSNGDPANKILIITAGLHAREWAAITSALYILNEIVTKFDQQPVYVKNVNWLIMPVLNPDGYHYTHTTNRIWRKNRSGRLVCRGVDLNRNFETDWAIAGIMSNNQCHESYSGSFPFSEAESNALRNLLLKIKKTPSAIVDIHSYGQMILYPWSARATPTDHAKQLNYAALSMSQAMFNNSKQNYDFGQTYHKIYPATGALIDFAYSSGITRSFAIEVRDNGTHGFLLPPSYIEATGQETSAAVRELARGMHVVNRGSKVNWF